MRLRCLEWAKNLIAIKRSVADARVKPCDKKHIAKEATLLLKSILTLINVGCNTVKNARPLIITLEKRRGQHELSRSNSFKEIQEKKEMIFAKGIAPRSRAIPPPYPTANLSLKSRRRRTAALALLESLPLSFLFLFNFQRGRRRRSPILSPFRKGFF